MAGRPMEFMLTMTQVPLVGLDVLVAASISSISPVMLAAYMTCLPVRSAWSFRTSQDRGDACFERAVRAVGLEFVVLDEVDSGLGETLTCCGRGFGGHGRCWA